MKISCYGFVQYLALQYSVTNRPHIASSLKTTLPFISYLYGTSKSIAFTIHGNKWLFFRVIQTILFQIFDIFANSIAYILL